MIFKNLLALFWKYLDVVCYLVATILLIIFAFSFGNRFGILAIAIVLLITGFLSEVISSQSKGGDN
ncbi:DUF1056 family protein [Fructilactobacillus fructivorans]|uniref:DUF1056 family protein n=1 Tax=Fructilactobacillus fructivorans TaxID=1614 RepID=A0AAE6TXZ3_9LACO|nr:DUF1056 family protein [Fructilactobacillus fructivorans]KRN40049.1 hypothetical protein IV51_GL000228 [Fructilactobacillus fructivorans]QFX92505.1 DUF1056 family protein [Fructilactobacillus fructivorans]RDV65900.1 DUF1056 family protein [Fructilactobacillus fructivorans]